MTNIKGLAFWATKKPKNKKKIDSKNPNQRRSFDIYFGDRLEAEAAERIRRQSNIAKSTESNNDFLAVSCK
jgi:hypothetical protein